MIAWLLAASVLSAGAQWEETRDLTPQESRGIRLWEVSYISVKPDPATKSVTFTYSASFKNETPLELAEIDVQVVLNRGSKTVYRGDPVPLRRFTNVGFGLTGSILPFEKTLNVQPLPITVPSGPWLAGAGADLRICGIKTFSGHQNLHSLAHLYTRMTRDPKSSISLFKSDPTLLRDTGSDGYDAIAAAWAGSPTPVIKYVAAHGGGWQPMTTNGITNMHLAALNGYPGVLDLALAHHGDVNAETLNSRRTPLYKAIRKGYSQNVAWLLKHGADPKHVDPDGFTAGYWAIQDGQGPALQLLLKAGAGPRQWDGRGWGWMHYAVFNSIFMPTVLSCGARVDDCAPKIGFTPLMLSLVMGQSDATRWLLQHGADPNRADRKGRTAYDFAKDATRDHSNGWFRGLVQQYGTKK